MNGQPSVDRLLRIIEMQNLIVGTGMGLDRVMEVVVEHATDLTRGTGAVIEMLDGNEFICRAASGSASGVQGYRLPVEGSLSGLCIKVGTPMGSPDTATDSRVDKVACERIGVASMVCVPLFQDDVPVGVLSVVSTAPRAFGDETEATLMVLSRVIAASLHYAAQYETVKHDSLHDALTGLENRRAFDSAITTAVERHRRYGSPLCLAILDLDGFKATNDKWGHAAGDRALREVADVIRKEKRAADTCYRIGGDEFALIMGDTTLPGARLAADRVCAAVKRASVASGTVGISAGVVEVHNRTESADELTGRADAELYVAKRAR